MRKFFYSIAGCCLLASCARGTTGYSRSDLPVVRDLAVYNEAMLELVHARAELSAQVIGTVEYPDFHAELYAVAHTPRESPRQTVLVTGGVHGNEPAGAEFTLDLIRRFSDGRHDEQASREALGAVREAGYPLEQHMEFIVLRTDDGLIDAPMWGLWYMRLTKQLSLSNYVRLGHSRDVYTLETPMGISFDDRVKLHDLFYRKLTGSAGISAIRGARRLPGA